MRVKGICKDCLHRLDYGEKGKPKRLYCAIPCQGRFVKNLNMAECPHYVKMGNKEERLK